MKTIRDYYLEQGLSCDKIMLQVTGFTCRETVHHAVRNPGRTIKKNFMEVAKILGMPESDAAEEWESVKADKIINNAINVADKRHDINLVPYLKDYS